jgi:hypothetical protein
VLDKGISHVYIKPRTPHLNGKVERSHRIDKDEFYALLRGVVIDSSKLFNEKIREWEHFYNYDRPHGGLSGQTPYERFKQKTSNNEPSVPENRQSYIPVTVEPQTSAPTRCKKYNGPADQRRILTSHR